MIILDKDSENHIKRIVLKPNCSINWFLLVRFYIFICVVSSIIAAMFTYLGAWMVLPFYGLELVALGIGLYVTCRKIYRQEVIRVCNGIIKIEKGVGKVEESWEFDTHWARITLVNQGSIRDVLYLTIGSHGKHVEVGSFLTESEKETLENELNDVILPHEFLR